MRIDHLFGKFRIQTKVLILLLPFIGSICVVGLIGLYSSSILQTRIEVSNSVVSSLSGFKEVNGSIDAFLSHPDDAAFKAVTARISDLQEAIKAAQVQTNASSSDKTELTAAADGAAVILDHVNALWDLQKRDDETRARFNDALQLLLGIELTMTEKVERIQKGTLRKQENRLTQLETTNLIASTSGVLNDFARRYSSLADEQSL